MKSKVLHSLMKKAVAGILAAGMLLSGICFLPTAVDEVYAAEAAQTRHSEQLDISEYQDAVAPKSTEEGWIFAGWYKDEQCETPVTTKPKTGSCYAKFVPAEVLSVRCQILSGTTETTKTSKLRLVSTVDTLNYSKVGFEIRYGENDDFSYETSAVWKKITAKDKGVTFDYKPSDICTASNYFTTLTLSNIPSSEYATGIYITPYWETLDGTKVYGESRFARVEDGYLNVVNVPVRVSADAKIAAGLLEVGYDADVVEYYGMDAGNILEEMDAADNGSVVRCVGNVEDITKNAQADGLLVNLRFMVKNGVKMPEVFTFAVSNEEFCDNAEKDITLDVPDAVYKTLKQK